MAERSSGNNQMTHDGSTRSGRQRRPGLTSRGERIMDVAAAVVIAGLAVGWSWSVVRVATALTSAGAPSAAFLTEAALLAATRNLRGASGRLRVQTALPGDTLRLDSLPPGTRVVYDDHGALAAAPAPGAPGTTGTAAPTTPGVRRVAVSVGRALRPVGDLSLITMLPFNAKRGGRIGLYYIGSWPSESGARGPARAPADRYANPRGFIQVTRENQHTRVSEHFRLRDFLTKNQPGVWPKYLVLEMRLVDKLELVLADLAARGVNTRGVVVMSGFRTPSYNVGGGNTAGRANLSRHMYGDGADIYIDNDRNGTMDDINRDGRVDVGDARFMLEAVERVERRHPELIGGAGVYIACCGHGPFIHIDTRGYRARWTGSSGG
jgi:hypothetical protein